MTKYLVVKELAEGKYPENKIMNTYLSVGSIIEGTYDDKHDVFRLKDRDPQEHYMPEEMIECLREIE